jgi:hypothetical protein
MVYALSSQFWPQQKSPSFLYEVIDPHFSHELDEGGCDARFYRVNRESLSKQGGKSRRTFRLVAISFSAFHRSSCGIPHLLRSESESRDGTVNETSRLEHIGFSSSVPV